MERDNGFASSPVRRCSWAYVAIWWKYNSDEHERVRTATNAWLLLIGLLTGDI